MRGFTLIELMIVVGIVAFLTLVAIPGYRAFIIKSEIAMAASDLVEMSQVIERFYVAKDRYPVTLAEVGLGNKLDPWGQQYKYAPILGSSANRSTFRLDGYLVPINSDFDLFSKGIDGKSSPRINARESLDDVVRGRNGAFNDVVTEF